MADGPAVLGRRVRAPGSPGVYVVELPEPRPRAPVDLGLVGRWIERVPSLRLDGERPTGKQLQARLAAFWLPSQTVLYVGRSPGSIAGRVAALERHVLGDAKPHPSSQWLKTLSVDGLKVWWATTDAPDEYEDALLDAFARNVPAAERSALFNPEPVLPFANQRTVTGQRKETGITGSTLPGEPAAPAPPTTVVDVPAGDADGARAEARGTGTVRRTSARAPGATPRATPSPRARKAPLGRPAAEPVLLSAEGLERLQAEHAELLARRPGIVARIKAAKELGDLKENSDYTAAREEQSFLEGRVQALEARLRAAVVVDAVSGGDRVAIGSTVEVEIDGDRRRFTIVGTTESNVGAGRLSLASPIGRALLGRSVGEEAIATTPGGDVPVKIVGID